MKFPSPAQIAVLLPISLLVHQLEEYFFGFPAWYSDIMNAQLSNQDFIFINVPGLLLIGGASLSYLFTKNKLILGAVGILILANGLIHLLLSIFTLTYSPGVFSGILFFLPLGIITYKKVLWQLSNTERSVAIFLGIGVLFLVTLIARNL